MENSSRIVIFSDGGSRGNPGPAASAYIIHIGQEIVKKDSEYLGITTNNVAEYNGVVLALEALIKMPLDFARDCEIEFRLDSELVVKQLKGEYKIKDVNMITLAMEVKKIIADNKLKITFLHVPRKENSIADKMVNVKLDEISRRGAN